MTDRPILCAGPVVRNILAGRQTQDRRILKIRSIDGKLVPITSPREKFIELEPGEFARGQGHYLSTAALSGPYPLGVAVGDRLYVRESWSVRRHEPCLPHERDWQDLHGPTIQYLADGASARIVGDRQTGRGIYHGPVEKGRPSIHMPRWASRLTLIVEGVKVERLQEITHEDAVAEGCYRIEPCAEYPHGNAWGRAGFAALWNQIHGAGAWDANPEVVAISFRVVQANIDSLPEEAA